MTAEATAAKVLFGTGSLDRLPELVNQLGSNRIVLITSPKRTRLRDRIAELLGSRLAGIETRTAMHVPESLAMEVRAEVRRTNADLLVAAGGGSVIGMAKAVALAGGPPILAVPTTYSGSEMTPIWGLSRGGTKETGREERVRPCAVIYDPVLTLDLPPRIAAPSAINAVAHCVEALYAPDASPAVSESAVEGLFALVKRTPEIVRSPRDLDARTAVLQGARLAGFALGACSMGLHHQLCHVLAGNFGLPHAETHAVILPHSVAYNAPAAERAMAAAAGVIAAAQGGEVLREEVPLKLYALITDLATDTGAPTSLRELGLREADIERVADIITARPYANPRPVTANAIRRLLVRAYRGEPCKDQ